MPIDVLVLEGGAAIPADDHGALYGDGVFRTVRVRSGRVAHVSSQLTKLADDARALGLAVSADDLERVCQAAAGVAAGQGEGTQRWSLTSGSGPRGYSRALDATLRAWISPGPPPAAPWRDGGVTLATLRHVYASQPALAGLKHMNRLDNVLARRELDGTEAVEGIVCDADGHAVGGTMSNLLFCDEQAVYTPKLDRCGVAGHTLALITEIASGLGIAVTEVRDTPDAIRAHATGVAVCNSVMGLCCASQWDGIRLGGGAPLQRLRVHLEALEC